MYVYFDHEGLTINLDLVEEFGKKENEAGRSEKKFSLYFIFINNEQNRELHYPSIRTRDDDFDKIMNRLESIEL